MNPQKSSNTISKSLEGLSSSTAARNKRGDWLSRNNSGILIKTIIILAIIAVATISIILAIPLIKIIYRQQNLANNIKSTPHNMIKNNSYGT